MPRPTFLQLMQQERLVRESDDFDGIAIGDHAAIAWRKTVADVWEQCVLERSAEDAFIVWSADGASKYEDYSHGRGEDGAPLNDSVEEE
eukprot:4648153-Pleurochrysis_carterae.AAC.1